MGNSACLMVYDTIKKKLISTCFEKKLEVDRKKKKPNDTEYRHFESFPVIKLSSSVHTIESNRKKKKVNLLKLTRKTRRIWKNNK